MNDLIPDIIPNEVFEFSETAPPTSLSVNVIKESNMTGGEPAKLPSENRLPGGPAVDRPIQGIDGKWYKDFGGTEIREEQAMQEEAMIQDVRRKLNEATSSSNPNITSGPETQTEGDLDAKNSSEDVSGIDVGRLREIYERCVAKYEGKYTNGLLDINVILDEKDKAEVRKIIDMAKSAHTGLAEKDPEWKSFVVLRDEMRDLLGTLGEDSRIVEDTSIHTPKKGTNSIGRVIVVPTSVYRLHIWEGKIGNLDRYFDEYDSGLAKGRMASPLGKDVKEAYRFVKESQTPLGQA